MARAARGRRALARCGRAREYPSCRGGRRGCSALRCAGVRGASQQRNPIAPPPPPPSLLLPLPMSLLYTHSPPPYCCPYPCPYCTLPLLTTAPSPPGATPKPRPSTSPPAQARGGAGGAGGRRGGGGVGRWGRVPPRTPRPACPMSTGGGTRRVRSVRGAGDACLLARLARRLKQEEPGARRQLGQRGAHARAGGSCRGPRRNHVVLENLRAARRKRRAGAAGGRGERRL